MDAEALMRLAIEQARLGIAGGESPFGCVVSLDGQVIARAHNCVRSAIDITAHAEITALRQACRQTGQVHLPGAIVAATCEPCPMCLAALQWARVETVYCGASTADAARAGFRALRTLAGDLGDGESEINLVPGILSAECVALFDEWQVRNRSAAN